MTFITKIAEYCKSIGGIISLGITIVAIGSGLILRHDAKVISDYAKENKSSVTITAVDSIVKLRTYPIISQIKTQHYNDSIENKKDRDEMTVVKSSITGYWKAKNEFQTVIDFQQNLLNTMNDLKKNDK